MHAYVQDIRYTPGIAWVDGLRIIDVPSPADAILTIGYPTMSDPERSREEEHMVRPEAEGPTRVRMLGGSLADRSSDQCQCMYDR